MVNKCSVSKFLTGSSQDQSSEKIPVLKIPTVPSILNEWMKAIPRKYWTPSCHSIVSSRHFNEEDFVTSTRDSNDRSKRKREDSSLFSEAIPEEERNPEYLPWVAFLFKQEKGR